MDLDEIRPLFDTRFLVCSSKPFQPTLSARRRSLQERCRRRRRRRRRQRLLRRVERPGKGVLRGDLHPRASLPHRRHMVSFYLQDKYWPCKERLPGSVRWLTVLWFANSCPVSLLPLSIINVDSGWSAPCGWWPWPSVSSSLPSSSSTSSRSGGRSQCSSPSGMRQCKSQSFRWILHCFHSFPVQNMTLWIAVNRSWA